MTLTILRKGQEQKLTVKLTKKEVTKRHAFGPRNFGNWNFDFDFDPDIGDVDLSNLKERLQEMKERLRDQVAEQRDVIRDAVMRAHDQIAKARDDARGQADHLNITNTGSNGLQTTKIDVGKAQIVFSDDKGELRIETLGGKRILTAKDPKGMLLFSGPVETKEDLDKVPPAVRERYEKLQQHDLPSVGSSPEDEEDNEDDDSGDVDRDDVQQISFRPAVSLSRAPVDDGFFLFRTVLI